MVFFLRILKFDLGMVSFSGVFFGIGLSASDLGHFFAWGMDPPRNRGSLMDSDRYTVMVWVRFRTSWSWRGWVTDILD